MSKNPHRLKGDGPSAKRARRETASSSDQEYNSEEEEEANLTQSADFDVSVVS